MEIDIIRDKYEKRLQSEGFSLLTCEENPLEFELANNLEVLIKESSEYYLKCPICVRFFWIDSFEINACVAKIDDTYCVGLFRGITTSLVDHIKTFYQTGLETLEGIEIPSKNLCFDVLKDDSKQGKLGNYIFTLAFFYLAMHEYGHIMCGHCDKELSTRLFFEQSKDIRGGYDAQAKEYMADFYGVAHSLTMVQCSFLSHLLDIGIITYLYITAIHSIFWIFNVRKDPLKDCDCSTMTHPHPMVRMGYFFGLIENELQHSLEMFERHEELIIKERDAAEQITNAAIEDFLNIIGRGDITFAVDDMIGEKCDDEIRKILKSVQEIKEYYRDVALIEYE